jgi:hypothetical protein
MTGLESYITLNDIILAILFVAFIFKAPIIKLSERVTKFEGEIYIDKIKFCLLLQRQKNKSAKKKIEQTHE